MTYYLPEPKKNWFQKAGDLAKAIFMPQVYLGDRQQENTQIQTANSQYLQDNSQQFNRELETRREKFALEKLKLDYIVQQDRDRASREFSAEQSELSFARQVKLANLSADRQKELEQYRQHCENLRQQNRQEHDKFMLAERHRLELEVQKRQQAFAIMQMYLQAQINRDTEQFRLTLSNHPWRLPPMTILNGYEPYRDGERPVPPLVVVSPPDVNFDRYNPTPNPLLGNMAKSLEEEMRVFFEHYKSEDLVNFKAGIWDTKRMASDTAATHLHDLFGTIPTIILESEVEGDFINFRVFWWDMGAEQYQSMTILSQFSLAQLLFEIQRDHARKWEQEKALLESVGIEIKSVLTEGSDELVNEYNLNQLKKEQQLKAIGSTIEIPYRANRAGMLELKKYLRVLHCLVGGLAVDDYHLMRYGTFPKLPSLIANLLIDFSEYESTALLDILVAHYRNLADILTKFDSVRVPLVMLSMVTELAKQTISHPQATELLNIALLSWLQIRQIEVGDDPLKTIENSLTIADVEFVTKLNQALQDLSETRHLDIATSCYQRGLRRNQAGEYDAARADFDQVISLNPHADAYFQRGFSCLKLQDYASAVKDFDSAAMLQSQRAEIYEYRGDAYLGLKNYEVAIANYNQAIHLGSSSAVTKRDKLQAWFTDERRRQQEAEAARQAAEAERKRLEEERRKALIFELPNNGGELTFKWINKGKLIMEGNHEITISEFRMGEYPITQRQYKAIMGTNPSNFTSDYKGENGKQCLALDRPVEQVYWKDAKAFCDKLNALPIFKDAKLKICLPSETQWEYACRDAADSNQKTKFWFGNNDGELAAHAWYSGTTNCNSMTHSVKEREDAQNSNKNASPNFGLVDMHGNVWEWCADNYTSVSNLPITGKPYTSDGDSGPHSVRGGAWSDNADSCASAFRYLWSADDSYYYLGFRVVVVEV
jgi:formylglycine-generating enzyme required for sulfatase activity/lipoprotein NlpI